MASSDDKKAVSAENVKALKQSMMVAELIFSGNTQSHTVDNFSSYDVLVVIVYGGAQKMNRSIAIVPAIGNGNYDVYGGSSGGMGASVNGSTITVRRYSSGDYIKAIVGFRKAAGEGGMSGIA